VIETNVAPADTTDVQCAWNSGTDNTWKYDMCTVNKISYDISVQVVCDCQEMGSVKIDSDLQATSDDDDILDAAVAADLDKPETTTGKSLVLMVIGLV
jgi:hypothetical protein